MATNTNKLPRITWGAAFVNTITFGYGLDSALAYDEPREGSEHVQGASGVEDAWIVGTDQVLEGNARWIPGVDSLAPDPVATGWDGATGWRAFLAWARDKNTFRFYPDTAAGTFYLCYLVEPLKGAPGLEDDNTRTVRLKIRNSDSATPFTGY